MKSIIISLLLFSASAHAVGLDYLLNNVTKPVKIDTVTPANSNPYPVRLYDSGGSILGFNNNYGVATGALRTASQIGNTTGQADFGSGLTGSQTLRIEANQGAANVTPWNVSISGTSPLPTGAATAANQVTGNNSLSSIDTKTPALGQALMAASSPVVIASNQSAIPVSGTVTVTQATGTNLHTVVDSGTVTANLGTIAGVATETTLAAMSAKFPATIGQKTSAASLAVTLASDQAGIATKTPINPNGSTVTNVTLTTVAQTLTVPANAVGFKIYALDTNAANIRMVIGTTATISTGIQLQPGRSEDFNIAANISVIAESGTSQGVVVIWTLNQ